MDASIAVSALAAARRTDTPPLVIDVRRTPDYIEDDGLIAGAIRRDPDDAETWATRLPAASSVVLYCARGHDVSRAAARTLRQAGHDAAFLEGGIAAWRNASGSLLRKPKGAATRWVTRERPKIDRIACPWLVSRFIDANADFVYVPATDVTERAQSAAGIPYDVPGAEYGHAGDRCSFDAFLRLHALREPGLLRLADIVRAADTGRPHMAAQAPGLVAISLGLSALYRDDHEMLGHGMVLYDALHAWCCAEAARPATAGTPR